MNSSLSNLRTMCTTMLPVMAPSRVGSLFSLPLESLKHAHARGLSSTSIIWSKSKDSGEGSGKGTTMDPDGYSLEMDNKSQEKLADLKRILEKNTYYEKYKRKIVESQKASPKSFLALMEQVLEAGKQAAGFTKGEIRAPMKTALDDVIKLEMLLKVEREDVIFIWQEYHRNIDILAATMNTKSHDRMCGRGRAFKSFVLPLPKRDGYELFLVQYGGESFHFTPMIKYQKYKENSPVCLSLVHYTELQERMDLVLMRGEYDKDYITLEEAQFLAVQLNLYYGETDEVRLEILKAFNQKSMEFEHMLIIEELKRMQTDYPHLFPKLKH